MLMTRGFFSLTSILSRQRCSSSLFSISLSVSEIKDEKLLRVSEREYMFSLMENPEREGDREEVGEKAFKMLDAGRWPLSSLLINV